MNNFSYQQLQRIKQLAILFYKYKNEKFYKHKLSGIEKFLLFENAWEFDSKMGILTELHSFKQII